MNCLIVEDELPAMQLLADNIRLVPFLKLSWSVRSAAEAINWLERNSVDLIFLDIEMPGISGIEFLRSLSSPPLIILISANRQYAADGFELNVVDYLIKPVPFPRFLSAINKANGILRTRFTVGTMPVLKSEQVFINANYSLVKVCLSEIIYIEGLKDHVKINLISGKSIITRLLLKDVEGRLSGGKFMRIHRSYIIALDKIDSVQKSQLVISGVEIPISEAYRQPLQNYISSRNF